MKKYKSHFPRPGIELGPLDSKSCTLPPRHYKSRLAPQGSTSVLYTYTRWRIYDNLLCNSYGYLQYSKGL